MRTISSTRDVSEAVTGWQSSSFTEIGKRRKRNEDAIGSYPDQQLWLVADGMGGHDAGDYASSLVAEQMSHYRQSRRRGVSISLIREILQRCNAELVDKARRDSLNICGTTVASFTLLGESIACVWSGDSRIYRFRNNQIMQLTRDHTVENFLQDKGVVHTAEQDAITGQQLTAAIGGASELKIEFCWYLLRPGDSFLLCTDGLYKEFSDQRLLQVVNSSESGLVASRLKELYLDSWARDNIGVIYVYMPL